MGKGLEETPLQEVVYKSTTQNNTPEALKAAPTPGNLFPYFAAAIVSLVVFMVGVAFGWPSPVLPKLTSNDTEVNPLGRPATHSETSWIASCLSLGALAGPLVAGPLADTLGRKKSLLVIASPMAVSLLAMAFARTVFLFCIMRFLLGVGAGSSFTILPIYLVEISEDHNRGILGCFMGISITSGLLWAYVIGPYVSIKIFCLLSLIPLAIFFVVFAIFIPETPEFLAIANKRDALEASLLKLRKKPVNEVQKEAEEMMKRVQEEEEDKGGVRDLFRSRGLRKGLTISIGLITFQQFAGINAVLGYMQMIFDAAGGGLAPEVATIIVGIVQVVACIVTSSIVERLGRKVLLEASLAGSAISLVALGSYFYLQTHKYDTDSIFWLPVLSLLVYIISFSIGIGPLPWAIMAELFPSKVKSAAGTLTSLAFFGGAFVIILCFPFISLFLGLAQSFWYFAIVCVGGMIFVHCVMPETKGKSLQEIQRLLEGYKS